MKKLYRSHRDNMIAGVCGGLGEMYSVDSTMIRLAFVFIGLITGILPLVVAYIIGWIIIPENPEG
ncbi:PspC domain-containing protein [Desulfobacterota bacterium AH_259_B03_O07]|nr:PspC domain-containing protein [Desulfobacterota bacterium AH_259_B03_O07]